MGAFWFRERARAVIERDFRSAEGPKSDKGDFGGQLSCFLAS